MPGVDVGQYRRGDLEVPAGRYRQGELEVPAGQYRRGGPVFTLDGRSAASSSLTSARARVWVRSSSHRAGEASDSRSSTACIGSAAASKCAQPRPPVSSSNLMTQRGMSK
eukprot:scaffold17329_cov59-Isochrysis_galbana.AAC.2